MKQTGVGDGYGNWDSEDRFDMFEKLNSYVFMF